LVGAWGVAVYLKNLQKSCYMVLSYALDQVMLIRRQLDKIRIVKRAKHENPKLCSVIRLLDVISRVRSMNNVF
jgi:hypothetical protein